VVNKLTLDILQTPNATNAVADTCGNEISGDSKDIKDEKTNVLSTRPVSSIFPPTAVPEMRDSSIDETSEAATRHV
jgi:hypothetical protein